MVRTGTMFHHHSVTHIQLSDLHVIDDQQIFVERVMLDAETNCWSHYCHIIELLSLVVLSQLPVGSMWLVYCSLVWYHGPETTRTVCVESSLSQCLFEKGSWLSPGVGIPSLV